jgi:hypothetical protein
MLGVVLVLQIITGITLAFHFTANITTAFNSIVHIHREIWYGGIIRFMHSNGAGGAPGAYSKKLMVCLHKMGSKSGKEVFNFLYPAAAK